MISCTSHMAIITLYLCVLIWRIIPVLLIPHYLIHPNPFITLWLRSKENSMLAKQPYYIKTRHFGLCRKFTFYGHFLYIICIFLRFTFQESYTQKPCYSKQCYKEIVACNDVFVDIAVMICFLTAVLTYVLT